MQNYFFFHWKSQYKAQGEAYSSEKHGHAFGEVGINQDRMQALNEKVQEIKDQQKSQSWHGSIVIDSLTFF